MIELLYKLLGHSPYWVAEIINDDCHMRVGLKNAKLTEMGIVTENVTISEADSLIAMTRKEDREMLIICGHGIFLLSILPNPDYPKLLRGVMGIPEDGAIVGNETISGIAVDIGEDIAGREVDHIICVNNEIDICFDNADSIIYRLEGEIENDV